ncbi:hypothetical protein O6H91_21G064400 [Diphasiastrum complanatum]|uniref:Uncharacterized protein n=1 Tax=Diphasiastrum complanatum TaxID=34168 RepID=A0ACC2ALB5_DIPCM|nr:hypothetical protein O6H91_21G064400 [Diphasiastrum complanatum]
MCSYAGCLQVSWRVFAGLLVQNISAKGIGRTTWVQKRCACRHVSSSICKRGQNESSTSWFAENQVRSGIAGLKRPPRTKKQNQFSRCQAPSVLFRTRCGETRCCRLGMGVD